MAKNRWDEEPRTATQYLKDADADDGNVNALARRLKMGHKRLWTWLTTPDRGFRLPTILKIRNTLGLPTIAILRRHEPIGKVVKEEREKTG
jgi:hypothetical protein